MVQKYEAMLVSREAGESELEGVKGELKRLRAQLQQQNDECVEMREKLAQSERKANLGKETSEKLAGYKEQIKRLEIELEESRQNEAKNVNQVSEFLLQRNDLSAKLQDALQRQTQVEL